MKLAGGSRIAVIGGGPADSFASYFLLDLAQRVGLELVRQYLGSSMHVFLLNIPRLEFAALIPKGEYVTMCLLGYQINRELVDFFLNIPEVRSCFPPDWDRSDSACSCSPRINIGEPAHPFSDRVFLIGDSGVSRLYKDGIGTAFRTAKASAVTAIFEGISARDFRRPYWPACHSIAVDNRFAKLVFTGVSLIRRLRFFRWAVLQMIQKEQHKEGRH